MQYEYSTKKDIFQSQQTLESYVELLEPIWIPSSVMFSVTVKFRK